MTHLRGYSHAIYTPLITTNISQTIHQLNTCSKAVSSLIAIATRKTKKTNKILKKKLKRYISICFFYTTQTNVDTRIQMLTLVPTNAESKTRTQTGRCHSKEPNKFSNVFFLISPIRNRNGYHFSPKKS